jgi:predicted transcriptional regulator
MGKLLGELEEKIMNILWEKGELKPAEVQSLLASDLAYTTVMTIMQRLAEKGFLSRRKQKSTYFYTANISKTNYVNTNLGAMLNSIVNSYGQLAISRFVDTVKTDPHNLDMLRKYLDEHADEE